MSQAMKTVQGVPVETTAIKGKSDYVGVAQRSRAAHAVKDHHTGYGITSEKIFSLEDRHFITVTLQVGEHQFMGTAEIHLRGGKMAEATDPMECAETSAIGRALAFAGFGALDSIASAEDVQSAQRRQAAPQPPSIGEQIKTRCNEESITADALKAWMNDNQYNSQTPAHLHKVLEAFDDPQEVARMGLFVPALRHEMSREAVVQYMRISLKQLTMSWELCWNAYRAHMGEWDARLKKIGQAA